MVDRIPQGNPIEILLAVAVLSATFVWMRILWAAFRSRKRPPLCPTCRLNLPERCSVPERPDVRDCRLYRPTVESKGLRVIPGGAEDEQDIVNRRPG